MSSKSRVCNVSDLSETFTIDLRQVKILIQTPFSVISVVRSFLVGDGYGVVDASFCSTGDSSDDVLAACVLQYSSREVEKRVIFCFLIYQPHLHLDLYSKSTAIVLQHSHGTFGLTRKGT